MYIHTVKVKVKAAARQFITSGLFVSDPKDDHSGLPPSLRDGLEPES